MTAKINFIKLVFAAIHKELEVTGFQKQKNSLMILPIDTNFLGWIGLNKALRQEPCSLNINPVIGARNQVLERCLAKMLNEPFDLVIPATLAMNVGYCSPERQYRSFCFNETVSISGTVQALCAEVNAYGLPFMQRMSNLATLVETMSTSTLRMGDQLDYRIPVGLSLLGRHHDAYSFIKKKIHEIGTRDDPAAVRYKYFASNFL